MLGKVVKCETLQNANFYKDIVLAAEIINFAKYKFFEDSHSCIFLEPLLVKYFHIAF